MKSNSFHKFQKLTEKHQNLLKFKRQKIYYDKLRLKLNFFNECRKIIPKLEKAVKVLLKNTKNSEIITLNTPPLAKNKKQTLFKRELIVY